MSSNPSLQLLAERVNHYFDLFPEFLGCEVQVGNAGERNQTCIRIVAEVLYARRAHWLKRLWRWAVRRSPPPIIKEKRKLAVTMPILNELLHDPEFGGALFADIFDEMWRFIQENCNWHLIYERRPMRRFK